MNYDNHMGMSKKAGGSNMPNASKGGHGAMPSKPMQTGGGSINMSNEMRSDVTKTVSNKHPYPNGLA